MHDAVVLLARIGLAGDELPAGETGPSRERAVELLDALRVAAEEEEKGRLRARRALGAEETQVRARLADRFEIHQEIAGPEGRALSHGRRLRGLVVRVRESRQAAVLQREPAEPAQGGGEPALDQSERLAHLDQVCRCR